MTDEHFEGLVAVTFAQAQASKYEIQPDNSRCERERFVKQITRYLIIYGKDQSVR
jgi:hypothetical protein